MNTTVVPRTPWWQAWATFSKIAETPFVYLRVAFYVIVPATILVALLKYTAWPSLLIVGYIIAILETFILIALAMRWQWFGLALILGGAVAVLQKTDTKDPDVTEAALGGITTALKGIGWVILIRILMQASILVLPWETEPKYTAAFFGIQFLGIVAFLYSTIEGFKNRLIRHFLVYGGVCLGIYLLLRGVWPSEVDATTTWASTTLGDLLTLSTIPYAVGLVLLAFGLVRLVWWMTLKKRKGLALAKLEPRFLHSALALLLLGTTLLLTPTIASWISTTATAWAGSNAKISDLETKIEQLNAEKPSADESAEGEKKLEGPKVVEKSETVKLPKVYRDAVEGEVTLTDNKWLVMQIPSQGECISYHPNVGTEDKRVGNHYMIRSLEGPLETYVHILELGESFEDYTCTN